ncbi:MAG: toprim domain-containing protein [Planctomycetes bacterium]|nr:toprim domain-containing protein [Planctomycetota bacterium]
MRGLSTPEGRVALDYVRGRGLQSATIQAFGIGCAPASGQALLHAARAEGIEFPVLEAAGLARQNEQGRSYDFFRGRLTIPIRDREGRPVGFGARRLSDGDESGPKYVNTAETRLFHKGRLVYALDKALAQVRRTGHIVLMEGYTDVMAAHQVGLTQCVAVLGTATTDDHAALIRRSGARRITLLFDGDEAGRKAAWKALTGLLHLEVAIDVVSLGGGEDPCDVLVREGAAPLVAQFELARDWFDFVCEGLAALRGVELSRAVDQVLELVARLPRPVLRESLVQDLSRRIGISVGALREQWRATHSKSPRPARREPAPAPTASVVQDAGLPPLVRESFGRLIGALVLDPSLVPLARPTRERCADAELAVIFDALLALYADENSVIDENALLGLLGEHPAHHRVVPLVEDARNAESPRELVEGELRFLDTLERRRQAEQLLADARRFDAELALRASSGGAALLHERPDELFQHEAALDAQSRGLAAS